MSRLKLFRHAAGISQNELATKSGISARMIQYYEQGIKDINKAAAITLYKLARALNVTIEDLLELYHDDYTDCVVYANHDQNQINKIMMEKRRANNVHDSKILSDLSCHLPRCRLPVGSTMEDILS